MVHTCDPRTGESEVGRGSVETEAGESIQKLEQPASGEARPSFGLPAPNMTRVSSLQWLLLFNFPGPSGSRSGCPLSAWGARSQRLCSSSGLHVYFKASPLPSHCTSCPCSCHLFADGTRRPGMSPFHPGQVKQPWVCVLLAEAVPGMRAEATTRKRC